MEVLEAEQDLSPHISPYLPLSPRVEVLEAEQHLGGVEARHLFGKHLLWGKGGGDMGR